MRNCITNKSIKLIGSYFKTKLGAIVNNDITYAEVLQTLYNETLNEFNNLTEPVSAEGVSNEEIVLQHLTIAPQIIKTYISSNPSIKNTNLENTVSLNAQFIYEATQKKTNSDFKNIIEGIKDLLETDITSTFERPESFVAIKETYATTHPNEMLVDENGKYTDKAVNPIYEKQNKLKRKIIANDNSSNYKLKLVVIDEVAYLEVVDKNNQPLYFDDNLNVVKPEQGEVVRLDVITKLSAVGKTTSLIIAAKQSAGATAEQAKKEAIAERNNYFKSLNADIARVKNNEDVYYQIDLTNSSSGFVHLDQTKRTKLSDVSNVDQLQFEIIKSGKKFLAGVRIPGNKEVHKLTPITLENLDKKELDFLFELISNNELKNSNNKLLTQKERNNLIQQYITLNSNPIYNNVFTVSYDMVKPNIVRSITFNNTKVSVKDVEVLRNAFNNFISSYTPFLYKTGSIPKGSKTVSNIEDVTYNQQILKDKSGNKYIVKKPEVSLIGLKNVSNINDGKVTLVESINNNVVTTKTISLIDRIKQVTETPIVLNSAGETKGYSPYLAFTNVKYRTEESAADEYFLSIEDSNKSYGKNVPTATTVEEKEAEAWFNDKETGWSSILNIKEFNNVNKNGKSFLASFIGNTINLWKGSDKTAIYHEVFHAYARGILSESERKAVYQEILNENKGKVVDIVVKGKKKTISFDAIDINNNEDQLALEEWLAEEFRAYAKNRSKYNNKSKSKIAQLFEEILKRLRNLFGNHTYSEVVLLNSLSPKINAIFNDVYEGNVDFSKFENLKPNTEYFSSIEIEIEGLSNNDVSITMSSMNTLLYRFVDHVINPSSNIEINTKLNNLLQEMSSIPENDPIFETKKNEFIQLKKSLRSTENSHTTGLFYLESNPELLANAFEYIYNKFNTRLNTLKNSESISDKKAANTLQTVLDNFGDIDLIETNINEFAGDRSTVIGLFLNDYSSIEIGEKEFTEDIQNKTTENLKLLFDRTGAEQSLSELIDNRTKELLSTLPNPGVVNFLGFDKPIALNTIIFRIATALEGKITMEEMYDVLSKKSEEDKTIALLLQRLGNPNVERGLTKGEIGQWKRFWKSFAKASIRLRTVELERVIEYAEQIKEGDPLEIEDLKIISKIHSTQFKESIIKREWSAKYQYEKTNPNNFFYVDSKIDLAAVIEEFDKTVYVDLKSGVISETPVDGYFAMPLYQADGANFLNTFGITLPSIKEVNDILRNGSSILDAGFLGYFMQSLKNRQTALYDNVLNPENIDDLFKDFKYKNQNNDTQTQQNLLGYFTSLSTLAGIYNDDYSTFMQKTPEGENQSTKPKHSSLSLEVTIINNAKSYNEIISIPGMEHYDYEINPEIAANNTFVKMFNLDSKTNFGERNESISIKIENLVGSIVKETSDLGSLEKGVKSISTDEFSKFTTDFYATLDNYQEIMRSEAKSTSLTVIMPTLKAGVVNLIAFNNNEISTILQENYKDNNTEQGLILYNLFKSHIESEIVRINRINELVEALENGEITEYQFDQKMINRGKSFIKFENILDSKTKTDLINLGIRESFQLDEMLTIEEKKNIENQLVDYFDFRSKDLYEEFGEKLILSDNLKEKYRDEEKIEEKLFLQFTINNFYQNLEYQSLFLGDPAAYNIKGEDYHKRIAGKISAGDIVLNEESWNTYVNSEEYNKDGFAKKHYETLTSEQKKEKNLPEIFMPNSYKGYLNTGIMAETVSESVYADLYKEYFGMDVSKYLEQEEADGAAWMKFDTYRLLLDSIGEWSDGQERVYQALLKGEKIDYRKIKNTFPIKKFQYYGPLFNKAFEVIGLTPYAFHKYSVIPIIPTENLKGTPLEDLHNRMMEEGIDYIAESSASKLSTISNITLDIIDNEKPVLDNIYDVNNNRQITNNPITLNTIHVKHLKSQVFLDEGFKGYISLPSQMRKISTLGIYSNGRPIDFDGTKTEWNKLLDTEKRGKSKFYNWIKSYNEVLDEIRTFSRNNLLENIGLKEITKKDGTKKYVGDSKKLAKYIKQELTNKNLLPEEVASIINPVTEELIDDLSFSLNSSKIEEVLMTLVDNELRNLKFNGEGLVQMPGTMFESKVKPKLDSKEEQYKYGTNGLSFYHVVDENGNAARNKKGFLRVKEAQVKIAMQGSFYNLFNLKYKGEKIAQYIKTTDTETNKTKKELDVEASIKVLNAALKDQRFVNEHIDKLRLVGPRIPTQAENSIESMIVKEFLSPTYGNAIVLPSDIVTKAGSDYDIDKLFMLFPNMNTYGENVEIISYDKSITESDEKLEQQLEKVKEELKAINIDINQLYTNKTTIFENSQEIKDFVSDELSDLVEQRNKLNNEIVVEIEEASKVFNNIGKYKNYTRTQQKEYHRKSTKRIDDLSAQRNDINQTINERINEIALETMGEEDVTKLFAKENKKIKTLEEKRTKLNNKRAKIIKKIDGKSIYGLQNQLLNLFAERVSFAENAEQLLTPNSTNLFDKIADELEKKLNETAFYNKYNRGKDKVGDGIAGTTIYDYRYNLQKHQENSVGLRSLGIAAVTSTFYAVFTQMGAKLDGVTKQEQQEFTKALETFKELNSKSNLSPIETAQLNKARNVINNYKDYSLKINHNKIGNFVSLSNLENRDGVTISNIIGQLINGYVDVAKKAWIYNIQGNLENTPQLLFMVMAGVPVEDAVYMSSNPLVIEYNKLKAQGKGVFANLTRDGKSIIKSAAVIKKEAQAKILADNPSIAGVNTFLDLNNSIEKDFTSEQLKNAALKKGKIDRTDLQILAHYIAIENMSEDITEFTMVNKFDTEKLQNLSQAQERIDQTNEIKSKKKSYSNDWFTDIMDTPIGKFANDQFILDLLSQYFGVRNNGVVISASLESFRPKGVEKAVHYNNFKNDFIWFLWQNSIFKTNGYKDFAFVENNELDQAVILDGNIVTINNDLIDEKIENSGGTFLGKNFFPTRAHYIRYEIERQLIEYNNRELTDEQFLKKYDHFQNVGTITMGRKGIIDKMALFHSGNNISMFNFSLGYTTILIKLREKYSDQLKGNQLFEDLRYDYFNEGSNLFLDKITDDDGTQIRAYKENLIELANHPIPEVSEFFKQFTYYAIMQSGLSKGKYNMTRIVDESVFTNTIENAFDTSSITNLLDKYTKLKNQNKTKKVSDLNVPYLSPFLYMFNNVSNDIAKYRTRSKGTNYITDVVADVVDGVIVDALSSKNVATFTTFNNVPAGYIKLENAEDLFNDDGTVNTEYIESIKNKKIAILNNFKFIAPEAVTQKELDAVLFNLNIDNSGKYAKGLTVSKGQTANNISISDSETLKKYSVKDEAMANSSTKAIGRATEGSAPAYKSSSRAYVNAINNKYREKLAGNKIKFEFKDKVWIFGSGIFENAYKGEMDKTQWENAVQKTFNNYHKKYIDQAVKAGVSTFYVGDATGIDELAIDYLKEKGFIPMSRYTDFGKYYEMVDESYKSQAVDNHLPGKAPVSISKVVGISFYSKELASEINKLTQDDLKNGIGINKIKAHIIQVVEESKYTDIKTKFSNVLKASENSPISEGKGLYNALLEKALVDLRNKTIAIAASKAQNSRLNRFKQMTTKITEKGDILPISFLIKDQTVNSEVEVLNIQKSKLYPNYISLRLKNTNTDKTYNYIANPSLTSNNVLFQYKDGKTVAVDNVTIDNLNSPFETTQPQARIEIQQNFEDGSKYKDEKTNTWKKRTMQEKFKGKSSMQLVLEGSRTRSTRSKSEIANYMQQANVTKVSDLVGVEILMYDKNGNTPGRAIVKMTNIDKFTQEYQDATWEKEGWTKDVTDRLVGVYPYAIEFEVVGYENLTEEDIKKLKRKDC